MGTTEVFNSFKDEEGKFKQELSGDIKGLMGLYEASQLNIEGEDMLHEAGGYSYRLLKSYVTCLGYPQDRAVVEHTLKYPHHKSLPKFMAKDFIIRNLQRANEWMKELQELAMIDFEMVQSQHQQEILRISE
ncbi:hypothetical protein P3X46_033374 [Hevea brasiliensis]|uniref:Terpene synthase N-terminal domain-containing protein n=1 Tax=Hevea brasiliensis TaxID=3981 RepID=A0ABQ9KG81_HEVBR|nr:hypothetical protein P3X46_033374 [Hevea brasiliensis]